MVKQYRFICIRYSLIFVACLFISLIIAGILNMWTLVFPVLLITPFMALYVVMKCWISNLLVSKVQVRWSKNKTIWISILLHILATLGSFIPIVIGLVVNNYCGIIFDVYMLIAYFVVSTFGLNYLWYLNWKKQEKYEKQMKETREGNDNG